MTNIVGVIKAQEKTVAQARGNNKRAEAQRAEAAVMYDVASAIAQAAREELHQHRAVLTQLQGARHTQRTGHEGPRDKGTLYPTLVIAELGDFIEVGEPQADLSDDIHKFRVGQMVKFTESALKHRGELFPSDNKQHKVLKLEDDRVYIDYNPVTTGWYQEWLELA